MSEVKVSGVKMSEVKVSRVKMPRSQITHEFDAVLLAHYV